MRSHTFLALPTTLLLLLTLSTLTLGLNIFDQLFPGGGGGGGADNPQFQHAFQQFQQQQQQQQGGGGQHGASSDSDAYRLRYENSPCDRYLCPDTLACVHFPHHCPCAFPELEEKVELKGADGRTMGKICASKGGWKKGLVERKIELARKGVL